MRTGPILIGLGFVLGAQGCGEGGWYPFASTLTATWTSKTRVGGSVTLPVRADWCPSQGPLKIVAVHGDTGAGLVIYPHDSLRSGDFPVFDGTDSLHPPPDSGVTVALRWFTETEVLGYQGDSGSASISVAGGRVSGTFKARMRSMARGDTIQAEGRFTTVRPKALPGGSCPFELKRVRGDSGVT